MNKLRLHTLAWIVWSANVSENDTCLKFVIKQNRKMLGLKKSKGLLIWTPMSLPTSVFCGMSHTGLPQARPSSVLLPLILGKEAWTEMRETSSIGDSL